ncbi:uracil-DNA glycosylase [Dialister pneumosintes]|jgi:uracil-DNA glycosylase, family 4|uniref:Type-4 uracil-DNA glycosylase n=2 Tax=Dialister pneumosintes TaxID=39950 RepID=A0ABX9MBL4_9FIRM|nr:uracil-DNA glycosylase [Dialister pneumosintes]RID94714.1 uracil-DNA glycosylase [Dialister pneumosintes]CDF27512.1 uracil-DNA glycosylase family 4 [Dialister sp. CAG:588]
MDLWGNEDAWDRQTKQEDTRKKTLTSLMTYEELENCFYECNACHLRTEGGHGPVLSSGSEKSPLMIVGEGPGGVEDEKGLPLVGPSGKLLDKALWSIGITRDRVYVTNIVKCRPRNNRTPTMQEANVCAGRWLIREIQIIKPKVILALGKPALRFFLGRDVGIIRSRGQWISWRNIPIMPTFHPAYLLRLEGKSLVDAKWQVYYDMKAAKECAMKAAPDWNWKSIEPVDLLDTYADRIAMRKEKNKLMCD